MAASNAHFPASEAVAAHDDDEVVYAEQLAFLIVVPMVMQVAMELQLFEVIAKAEGFISAEEIADQLLASDKVQAADKLDRMLRLLAAYSVVTSSVDAGGRRVYGLAPAGRYFLRDDDAGSYGQMVCLNQDKVPLASWSKLKDAILQGGVPFNKAHGMQLYEYLGLDQRFNHVFNIGMLTHTTLVMKNVVQHYKGFENLKQLVDVAGGIGHTLKIIISKYPSIKGINFDLPHVIENAISFPGVQHVGGDMFESIPSPAEAIFMKWVLLDWDDDHCVKLLKNCYSALANNGKVIAVEHILADEGVSTSTAAKAVLLTDMMVITQCPTGRERTKKEFIALANAAGFTTIKFQCCICNFWVMEFCK